MATRSLLLTELPVELLEHVFSFLRLSDRKSVSLACHSLNDVAFNRRSLRNLRLNLSTNNKIFYLIYLNQSTRKYCNVMIGDVVTDRSFEDHVRILDLLGADLESFHCPGTLTDEQLWSVVSRAPNLKELLVTRHEDRLTIYQHQFSFPEMSCLRTLGSERVLRIPGLKVPNLTELDIKFVDSSDAVGSIFVLKSLASQLTSLKLDSNGHLLTIRTLRFPKLEVLKLTASVRETNGTAMRPFYSGFKCLKAVSLTFDIDSVVLDDLTKACPEIEDLEFQSCVLTSNAICLLERLERLKKLTIIARVIQSWVFQECKPLTSVTRFILEIHDSYSNASVIEGFRQLLPNVTNMSVNPGWYPGFVRVVANYSHRKRLTIQRDPKDSGLSEILRCLHPLEELTIQGNIESSKFMLRNPCLKRLKIKGNALLTDRDLLPWMVSELYPNLKRLELSRCNRVMADCVDQLRWRLKGCEVHCVN